LIEEIIEYKGKQEILHGRNTKYVFPNQFGKMCDPRTYTDLFYEIVEQAGIEHKNFHCTRHTFATRYGCIGTVIHNRSCTAVYNTKYVRSCIGRPTRYKVWRRWLNFMLNEVIWDGYKTLGVKSNVKVGIGERCLEIKILANIEFTRIFITSPSWIRTSNPSVNSRMLCR